MQKKLLIIGYVWPEPKSSAAGSRMLQLIAVFLSENYKITFASPCAKTKNAFNLDSINVSQCEIELNNSSFDVFVKDLNPNIVIFDRFMMEEQFGWRVTENCPKALKILDTEDLHCLRKGRHEAFKKNVPFNKVFLFNNVAKREIASIYRCDLSLIISEEELKILETTFNVDKTLLLYLPFMVGELDIKHTLNLPKFKQRQHFVTIGNFLHAPNYNAVLYLKEIIWPLIKKEIPDAELHIYGAYTSKKVDALHNQHKGFIIKGFTKNANTVIQNAKVLLAPIRFGAGLKGKLIDAMVNGTPCVTTTIGAEGMYGNMEPNGLIHNTSTEFAKSSADLYNNKVLWQHKQDNGFKIINKRFNDLHFKLKFLDVLREKIINLESNRLNNFTGQMLNFHTLQSTKYMSKWIAEKNK